MRAIRSPGPVLAVLDDVVDRRRGRASAHEASAATRFAHRTAVSPRGAAHAEANPTPRPTVPRPAPVPPTAPRAVTMPREGQTGIRHGGGTDRPRSDASLGGRSMVGRWTARATGNGRPRRRGLATCHPPRASERDADPRQTAMCCARRWEARDFTITDTRKSMSRFKNSRRFPRSGKTIEAPSSSPSKRRSLITSHKAGHGRRSWQG